MLACLTLACLTLACLMLDVLTGQTEVMQINSIINNQYCNFLVLRLWYLLSMLVVYSFPRLKAYFTSQVWSLITHRPPKINIPSLRPWKTAASRSAAWRLNLTTRGSSSRWLTAYRREVITLGTAGLRTHLVPTSHSEDCRDPVSVTAHRQIQLYVFYSELQRK